MKRILLILYIIASSICVYSQTQQGYVKTRGRLSSTGKLIPGVRLQGATISVKNSGSYVSGNNGAFAFAVPSQSYYLTNVQKKDYQLCDRDVLGGSLKYSPNPLVVVMDTPDQILEDRLESEGKIRATLTTQLNQKKAELKQLKEQQKISQQEYNKLLQEIYALQNNNEKLISEMSERYSTLDFEEMDEFQRTISYLIQNGELTKADSLLRTKDIKKLGEELDQMDEIIQADAEDIAKRQAAHEQAVEFKSQKLEEFASLCYNNYEVCKLQQKIDSAAYWLELRASKDTLNFRWQKEAADYLSGFVADTQRSFHYDSLCYRLILKEHGEKHIDFIRQLNTMALVHAKTFGEADSIYCKALSLCDSIETDTRTTKAAIYNNRGDLYREAGYYEQAMVILSNAYLLYKEMYGENSRSVANVMAIMGLIDIRLNNNEEAMLKFNKALDILNSCKQDDNTILTKASLLRKIGVAYIPIDSKIALEYCTKSLTILNDYYPENHPTIGEVYNYIGAAYYKTHDLDNAIEYFEKSLKNGAYIGLNTNNLGVVFKEKGDLEKALQYYKQGMEYLLLTLGDHHLDVALSCYNIGNLLYEEQKYEEAIPYFIRSLGIYSSYENGYEDYVLYISNCLYECLFSNRDLYEKEYSEFMENTVFLATVVSSDSPSAMEGMNGTYFLLSMGDWDMYSTEMLGEAVQRLKDSQKAIVVMKDGIVESFTFNGSMGLGLTPKYVGKEEKLRVIDAYNKWQHKNGKKKK